MTVGVFGCAHSDLGPFELADLPAGGPGGLPDPPDPVGVSLGEIRIHQVDLEFQTIMYNSSVNVELWDELGTPVEIERRIFGPYNKTLTLSFPAQFCQTYGLKVLAGATDLYQNVIEEDVFFEAPMGPNPYDIDQGPLCNADAVISPVFTDEVDGMIMLGDEAAVASGMKDMGHGDVDNDLVWYTDGSQSYDGADRMIVIPELVGIGTTGFAKLFMHWGENQSKNYTLEVWSSYEPIYENPSAVFTQTVVNTSEHLIGPFDAGDLNGDGARELIVAGQKSTSDQNLLQRLYLLKGPIHPGQEAGLSDSSEFVRLIGSLYDVQKPLVSVGDIDADGFDDLASISYRVSEQGETSNWHVDIFRGDEELIDVFMVANHSEIVGSVGREIVEVGSGDLNGDGIEDLIIADVWKRYAYGDLTYTKPRVLVFLGGRSFNGLYVEEADFAIDVNLSSRAYVNTFKARSVGDMDGDGTEELAVGLIEQSATGRIGQSDVYLMLGRTVWQPSVRIAQQTVNPYRWALRIVSGSSKRIILEDDYWDSRVGDVDNDGYYDLMLKVLDYTGQQVLLYFGNDSLEREGGVTVELDEVDAAWSFSVP
jgi:hypothetical protein